MGYRIEFWGDQVEKIIIFDPLTGEIIREESEVSIYPARHFVTNPDNLEKAIDGIEIELESQLKNFRKFFFQIFFLSDIFLIKSSIST